MSRARRTAYELILSGSLNVFAGINYAKQAQTLATPIALRVGGLGQTILTIGAMELLLSRKGVHSDTRNYVAGFIMAQDLFHITRIIWCRVTRHYDTTYDPAYGWVGLVIALCEFLGMCYTWHKSKEDQEDLE